MKKYILSATAVVLFATVGIAQAAPFDQLISYKDSNDVTQLDVISPPTIEAGVNYLQGFYGDNSQVPMNPYKMFTLGAGFSFSDSTLIVDSVAMSRITGLTSALASKADSSAVAAVVSPIQTTMSEIAANLYGTSTTMRIGGSSTTTIAGLVTLTDKTKWDSYAPVAKSLSTSTRSIVTGTGATGFQVSSTRDARVCYTITIATASTLLTPVNGVVVFESSPTNSASAGSWSEQGRSSNGDTVGIIRSGSSAGQVCGFLPAGYYGKIRSINVLGTPTYTYNSGFEVLE